jgi:hypothetical protein
LSPTILNKYPDSYLRYQQLSSYGLALDPSVNVTLIGQRLRGPALQLADLSKPLVMNTSTVLDSFETRYFMSFNQMTPNASVYYKVPWYTPIPPDLDTYMATELDSFIKRIASINNSIILDKRASSKDMQIYQQTIRNMTEQMPYGAILIKKANVQQFQWELVFSIGSDSRLNAISYFPRAGYRLIEQMTKWNNGILKTVSNYTIVHGLRVMRIFH